MTVMLATITQQTLNPGRIPLAHVPLAEAAPGRTNALYDGKYFSCTNGTRK